MDIVIRPEAPGDYRSLFRVLIGERLIAEGLTAAGAHRVVGDILEQLTLPKPPARAAAAARQ